MHRLAAPVGCGGGLGHCGVLGGRSPLGPPAAPAVALPVPRLRLVWGHGTRCAWQQLRPVLQPMRCPGRPAWSQLHACDLCLLNCLCAPPATGVVRRVQLWAAGRFGIMLGSSLLARWLAQCSVPSAQQQHKQSRNGRSRAHASNTKLVHLSLGCQAKGLIHAAKTGRALKRRHSRNKHME